MSDNANAKYARPPLPAALDQSQKSECASVKREAEEDWGR